MMGRSQKIPRWLIPPVLRRYKAEWVRHDVGAGIQLTAMLIPAGMAYSVASGLPPAFGLYATIAALIAYAVVGPSRVLVLGPDSALAPMIVAALTPLAADDQQRSAALAALLALLVGGILLLGSLMRLGNAAGLLSKPIRLGYINGIAVLVAFSQLPALVGVTVESNTPWERALITAGKITAGQTNPVALVLAGVTLALIWLPRVLRLRIPGIFLGVLVPCLAVAVLNLKGLVHVTGALPAGLPAPALGRLVGTDIATLFPAAAAIALIVFVDTGALSQSLAAAEGRRVSGNREMAALGTANVASGLMGGIPVSASTSRTPVALAAGAKTQLTGVVGALLVLTFMIAAPGVTEFLPASALAAVVVAAAIGLAAPTDVLRLIAMSRSESLVMVAAFLGVTVLGVLQGVAVAVGLALLDFVRQAWTPYRAELVDVPSIPGYHDVSRHPDGKRVPGVLILRFDAPLFFGNGSLLGAFVRDELSRAPKGTERVVLASEPITGIDTTALDDLVQLDEWLSQQHVDLVFAELKGPVKDKLLNYGMSARFSPEHFFPTVGAAVRAYQSAKQAASESDSPSDPPTS